MNHVVLIGRTTRDPELRKTQSGASVASFTLAVNRPTKGQPDTDFISCVAWNKTADAICAYVHKGDQIAISGRIQVRNYDDKDGKRVYITEVVCNSVQSLESKKTAQSSAYKATEPYNVSSDDPVDIESGDLPF